ncbi:MAG: aminopeptidase P family protein [Bacilli bacterium]|nr:aminopeptidase P family protein [Bacilli bacterium]
MNQEFYVKTRKKYFNKIKEGTVSLFYSGEIFPKSGDQDFDFEVDKNFYYLTGINQANVILALIKGKDRLEEFLFIEANDPLYVKWYGAKLTIDEAKKISGIQNVHYLSSFENVIFSLFNNTRSSGTGYKEIYLNLERRNDQNYSNWALRYAKKFAKVYPEVIINNSYDIVIGLRATKESEEVELIKESIAVTKTGIEELMKHSKPGLYEYQIESYFDQHIKFNGQRVHSFKTIAATGVNATILHYVFNNTLLQDGELILFDLGCSTKSYISDITRTFPVNGKFTNRQAEVYQEVLNVNKKCIDFLKAGITWKEYQEFARDLIIKACKKLNLITEDKDVTKYYWHGIGHSIGLDTHDPSPFNEPLQAGTVLTVEPGIYIEEEKIGIRIEDNVLITDNGCLNLSKDIIKEIKDIENFMK